MATTKKPDEQDDAAAQAAAKAEAEKGSEEAKAETKPEAQDDEKSAEAEEAAPDGAEKTVTVADRVGNEFQTPVGADGQNPVSPNNPPAKAISGSGNRIARL